MAFSTKFGSFNSGTATATNTVAVTGVGFQPSVVLMWWVGRTDTTDAVGRANTLLGFGAAISTSSRYCTTQYSLDAAATSDGGLLASSTACVQVCDGGGASTGALDHQSMDAGGFTLVVDVQFAASIRVHYLALGGADLTNYKLATMTAPTSTGNLAYTGVGFQPDFVMMLINGINGGIGGSSTRQPFHIGAAKSSSSRWTVSAGQDDGSTTMDAWSYANDIECVGIVNAVGGATPEAQADFVSMDADGFTLNWTRAFGTSARGGWYLALKGGQYALGSVLTQTDTTTDIVVSGLGFSPVGGLVVSHNQAESAINTATANANMSIGGFDSATSRGAVAYMDENALADSEITTAVEHDEVYANVDGGALLGLMDVKSVDSGGVTFVMDDADPAQYFATYMFFGSAVSGISGTLTQTQANNTISATGTLAIKGDLSQPQAGDTLSSSATLSIAGIVSQTQASDSVTSTAELDIAAVVTQTQAGDTLSSTATISIAGVMAQTQAGDTLSSTAELDIVGTLSQTQTSDTLTATGVGTVSTNGDLNLSQADNTIIATAAITLKAAVTQTQAGDVLSSIAALQIQGVLGQSQADNTTVFTSALYIQGAINVTQEFNSIASIGAEPAVEIKAQPDLTFLKQVRREQKNDYEYFMDRIE